MENAKSALQGSSTYSSYLLKEWEAFDGDSGRQQALLEATRDVHVARVLGVGCGAGQEMLPYVARGARGVGIDSMPEAGQIGRLVFTKAGYLDNVDFLKASGTEIPFADQSFDVVICRVALMYMKNTLALAEISRVLRSGARLFLKYHSPAYYWTKFASGLQQGHFKSSSHAVRVLGAGYAYCITGRQPFNRLTAGGEMFQTKHTLERELARVGLRIVFEMPDSNKHTPSLAVTKD